MKKTLAAFLAIIAVISGLTALTGCGVIVAGSGVTQTFEMDYTNFSRLEIGYGFDMAITRADTFYVSITIDKALYEYLNIGQRGDTLYIGLKPNNTYTAASRTGIIQLPDIRRLELSGGSKAGITGFTMEHNVDFDLSGASRLVLNPMQAGDTSITLSGASTVEGKIQISDGSFDLSGGSKLTLDGTANSLKISASGASTADIINIPVATASIELSGASYAVVRVSDVIDVDLSGGSELDYAGSPKLGKMEISGGSKFDQIEP